MILKANQRAGGTQLALHLLNDRDNDHVEVHELRGFVSDDLVGAFKEVVAVNTGTKCQQFLFSLSLSPPEKAIVPVEDVENSIAEFEEKMKLTMPIENVTNTQGFCGLSLTHMCRLRIVRDAAYDVIHEPYPAD